MKFFFVESNSIYNGEEVLTSIYNMFMKEKLKKQIAIERANLTPEEKMKGFESFSDFRIWNKNLKEGKNRILREAKGLPRNSTTPVYEIEYKDFRKVMEE